MNILEFKFCITHFGSVPFLFLKLADAKDVMDAVHNLEGARFPVLTPNLKVSVSRNTRVQIRDCLSYVISLTCCVNFWQGFEAAIAAGAKDIAVFASASESFSKSNINCSIEESLFRYRAVTRAAKELSIPVRGYVLSLSLSLYISSSDCVFES